MKAVSKNYFPKMIRGQMVKGYCKVSIKQVEKYMNLGNKFIGFIVGNKVSSYHFHKGWHLACDIEKDAFEEFNDTVTNFLWYLDAELGNRAAIYLKINPDDPKQWTEMRSMTPGFKTFKHISTGEVRWEKI